MSELYLSEGKQDFRELLLALARLYLLRTFGTFYGTGIDSRLFAGEGFQVTAAELVRARHPAMDADGAINGFATFHRRASHLRQRFDLFHADFDGGPSPRNFREVRGIAAITDRWLAVTMSLDHVRDASMMGEAAAFTIPAWLTGASGFTLEYVGRYRRNAYGQVMWVAILQRHTGKGTAHQVLPVQIAYSLRLRNYWASRQMYRTGLLPHRYSPENEHEKRQARRYYEEHREVRLAHSRASYERRKQQPDKIAADRAASSAWARSERGREWQRAWAAERRRTDPDWVERRRAYRREWYRRKKLAAVQSTTAEAQAAA